jgi:ABC-type Fe3+ transport system substrate-binding protein
VIYGLRLKGFISGGVFSIAAALVFLLAGQEASAQADWQKRWNEVLAAARKEGTVVVAASPSPDTRAEMEPLFMKQYGFKLEYLGLAGAESTARVEREGVAGRPTLDILLSGNTELFNLLPAGRLESLKDKLILPEVLDLSKWRDNKLKFNDAEERYLLQSMEYILPDVFVNRNLIKQGELTSWKDLLKPEYRGKIASFDPRRPGQGQAVAAYLLKLYGPEFVKALFVDQKVVYTGDRRQMGDWLARGTYPIAIAVATREVEDARALKIPIERPHFPDAPGGVTGGSGTIKIVKNAPHPNAAIVFANWFLTREAQEIFQRTNAMVSRRKDAGLKGVPEYVVPKDGINYMDTYSYDYTVQFVPQSRKMLSDLLGGR